MSLSDVDPQQAVATLQKASDGLLFPSETDAPLVPFFWPAASDGEGASGPPSPETLTKHADLAGSTPVKTVRLDTFFRPATEEEEWHNADEKAQVQRFQELVKTIKSSLDDVKVFRVGETVIDVYIVGIVPGGYAGLKTKVVET